MRLQSILIGLFVALVTTTGVLWFLNTYEYKEVDEYSGFRGEARENPLFAARLFLKRMGIPSERQTSLQTLPSTNTVLVIDTDRYTLSRQKSEALLAWVAKGGHLITRTRDVNTYPDAEDTEQTSDRDPLQLALGITTGEHVIPEDDDLPLEAELSNMSHPLQVDPEFFYALQTTAAQAYPQTYNDAAWLLEMEHGNGLITWAANLDFIQNPAIDNYDHAEFFWHMLHSLHDEPQAVWLLHNDEMPGLARLLWEYAWALVLSLAVFIPLTILALSPRFGPMIPKPAPERRRILEHIHASGLFMWQRHRKHADTQYDGFATRVTQLLPSTRKQHDNSNPDA